MDQIKIGRFIAEEVRNVTSVFFSKCGSCKYCKHVPTK